MRRHIILFALSLCTAFSALGVPVTFQVDLGPRINTGEFDATTDIVEVRGSFNDWSGGFALTNTTENPTIFKGTRDLTGTAGSEVQFKFVQVRGDVVTWESTPNRPFPLPETATTLPLAYFNNVWEGAPVQVKFQVNMATQKASGAFVPAEGDFVELRGGFNAWSAGTVLTPSTANPDIYETTVDVPDAPGARVEYKFVLNKAATGALTWESDPNRGFIQTAEAQTLPVVYFNNATGTPVKAAINFQVDMSVYIAAGLFDTNTQEVYVRGNKMGWGNPPAEGLQLIADTARPGIYTNTYRTDGQITGDRVEYKFTIWTPELAGTTWEDGGNKTLAFTGTEPKDALGYHLITIEPNYFNGVTPGSLLNEETVVTFRVDMRNARTTGGTAFDPAVDTVAVNGSFLPGGWQPWDSLSATQAFDDGATGGDATAGDLIYTVQVTLPRGANSRLAYKYGINGQDNEAAVGNDRIRYVRASGTYTLPVDVFGTMTQESETLDIGPLAIDRAATGVVTITWPAEPGARLQEMSSLSGGGRVTFVTNSGESSYVVPATNSMGFYRLVKP
jgi:hypothetical protein